MQIVVTPWVHIPKSKVDESNMSALAARLAGINAQMPPVTTIQSSSESEQVAT